MICAYKYLSQIVFEYSDDLFVGLKLQVASLQCPRDCRALSASVVDVWVVTILGMSRNPNQSSVVIIIIADGSNLRGKHVSFLFEPLH
jgi:hypothetical protein